MYNTLCLEFTKLFNYIFFVQNDVGRTALNWLVTCYYNTSVKILLRRLNLVWIQKKKLI